ELGDVSVAFALQKGPVEAVRLETEAVLGGVVRGVGKIGGIPHDLLGNTADIDTGSPQPARLDDRHACAILARAPRAGQAATATAEDWKTMENPLLGQESLPPFAQIRPEHVEPGVRELLERGRARIGEIAALEKPTFATVVEPLEELQHRVSRTWSPVSHLNAVLNSDALRAGYNACLPLLSAYQ